MYICIFFFNLHVYFYLSNIIPHIDFTIDSLCVRFYFEINLSTLLIPLQAFNITLFMRIILYTIEILHGHIQTITHQIQSNRSIYSD